MCTVWSLAETVLSTTVVGAKMVAADRSLLEEHSVVLMVAEVVLVGRTCSVEAAKTCRASPLFQSGTRSTAHLSTGRSQQ